MKRAERGFTLVELSIVLVILGLLVGGVLTGQSLIRAAELRAVSTEFSRYHTALYTFRDKYFALPGDMPNAVRYWGAATGGTADGVDSGCISTTTASTDARTCNGNGDGLIGSPNSETFRVWQQLANAGLIEGNFTGVTSVAVAGSRYFKIGQNVPRSKLNPAGWSLYAVPPVPVGDANEWTPSHTSGWWYAGNYGNVMIFGTQGGYDVSIMGGAMKPEEAFNIDTKMDDGKPNTGNVRGDTPVSASYNNGGQLCTSATAYEYQLNLTTKTCALIFLVN